MEYAKLCLMCGEFRLDTGCGPYSESTPGDPFDLGCKKNQWSAEDYFYQEDLRRCMQKAETCKYYWHHAGRKIKRTVIQKSTEQIPFSENGECHFGGADRVILEGEN